MRLHHSALEYLKKLYAQKSHLTIALSGGTAPIPLYGALADSGLPFEHIEFFQVDERYVPRTHPDSNYKLIHDTFLSKLRIPPRFHAFDTSLPIPQALDAYEKELPARLDLCILGIGKDGHTASLFPHSPALHETRPVAHTQTDEFAVKDRLTLTFPPILASRHLLVLLRNKPEILKMLQQKTLTKEEFPAIELCKHPDLVINTE